MRIEYCQYILEPKNASFQKRNGAILKVQFDENLCGYADCHPWPQLGDRPLEDQLGALKKKQCTPLTRSSLKFARMDAEARHLKKSILEYAKIPLSHFFIEDLLNYSLADIEQVALQGFTHIKIKLGKQLPQEIGKLFELFSKSSFKLRLDFNERLSPNEFRSFLKAIEKLRESIDFIEDPFPYHALPWKEFQDSYSISLACDRQVLAALQSPESASVLIVKPAVVQIEPFVNLYRKVIVTSYLDHPIGQLSAAYAASQIDPRQANVHGLLSHHVYLPNAFSEKLSQKGPQFHCPRGTGFGYDDLISEMDWKLL